MLLSSGEYADLVRTAVHSDKVEVAQAYALLAVAAALEALATVVAHK